MTAAEIIEQIKALSPEEQREISRFVLEHFGTGQKRSGPLPTREPIKAIAKRIFERHDELFKKLAE